MHQGEAELSRTGQVVVVTDRVAEAARVVKTVWIKCVFSVCVFGCMCSYESQRGSAGVSLQLLGQRPISSGTDVVLLQRSDMDTELDTAALAVADGSSVSCKS